MKRYQLLQFIDEQKSEASSLDIDRVPCRWVRYDVDIGHVVVKFPPPPYTAKKYKLLESLIKTEGEPLPNWPEYPVELIGHADTYTDAVNRLVVLEKESFAFTTDSDVPPAKKAAQLKEQLKKQSLRAIMKVPTMEDEGSADPSSSIDDQYDSQSSSDETQTHSSPIKIKKVQGRGKVIKNIPPKKVVESRSSNPGPSKSTVHIEGAKVRDEVLKKVQPKDVSKPRGDSGSSKSKATFGTIVVTEKASDSVQEFDPIVIEVAKVGGEVQTKVQRKDVAKPRGNPGSSTSDHLDIKESGELEHDPNTIENSQGNDEINLLSTFFEAPMKKKTEIGCLRKHSAFEESLKIATQTLQKANKEYSKDTLLIMSTLTGLRLDLQANTKAVDKLCAVIENPKQFVQGKITPSALVLENEFNLPFETIEQFKDFDVQLREDTEYRQHCAATLLFYIDPENHVNKSITNIMKKFVGRDVAMLFTAKKQTVKKEVFKNMKFCAVMLEVLIQHHTDKHGKPVCEKYIFQCIGQALANAKDWDGFRVKRAEKEMEKKRLLEQEMAKKRLLDHEMAKKKSADV